jgi:hypothetical protein
MTDATGPMTIPANRPIRASSFMTAILVAFHVRGISAWFLKTFENQQQSPTACAARRAVVSKWFSGEKA